MTQMQQSRRDILRKSREKWAADLRTNALVVVIFLIALGFPGTLESKMGGFGTVIRYSVFLLQIATMLLSSADSVMDIRIINIDYKYMPLYLYALIIFVDSMLVTYSPKSQILACVRLSTTILYAIWLQEQFDFNKVIELLCYAQAVYVAVTIFTIIVFPSLGFDSVNSNGTALQGITTAKNSLATELVFGCVCTLTLIETKRKERQRVDRWLLLFLVQLVMLLLCQGTAMVITFLLLLLLHFFMPTRLRLPIGWLYIALSVFFLFAALTFIPKLEWFFDLVDKDPTISGRIPMWQQLIDVMLEHNTLTGFGYTMFWEDPEALRLFHAGFERNSGLAQLAAGAHNMLMESWVNTGLIGTGSFSVMVLLCLRKIKLLTESVYRYFVLFFTFITINGFTERCFGSSYDYKLTVFFWLLAYCCNWEKNGEPSRIKTPKPRRRWNTDVSAKDGTEETKN